MLISSARTVVLNTYARMQWTDPSIYTKALIPSPGQSQPDAEPGLACADTGIDLVPFDTGPL